MLGSFFFGYWIGRSADCYSPYCYYSPFYSYGFPYVYRSRVQIVEVPVYTYVQVPYSYGTTTDDYYLRQQETYPGLDAALDDIRRAWMDKDADRLLRHVDSSRQVQIFANGEYLYSLSGSDYRAMVRDALSRVRTVAFSLDDLERRSDGGLTARGRHEFYDIDGNLKTVDVSYTLKAAGGRWIIVATESSEA